MIDRLDYISPSFRCSILLANPIWSILSSNLSLSPCIVIRSRAHAEFWPTVSLCIFSTTQVEVRCQQSILLLPLTRRRLVSNTKQVETNIDTQHYLSLIRNTPWVASFAFFLSRFVYRWPKTTLINERAPCHVESVTKKARVTFTLRYWCANEFDSDDDL